MSGEQFQTGGDRRISGKPIVFGMLVFATVMVFCFWLYWKLHTAPFAHLQQAIVKEFPDFGPVVQGGQRKMHQDTPRILRVVLRVDFDPDSDEQRIERIYSRVAALAGQHQDLESYDQLEVNLFFMPAPEQGAKTRTITRPTSELTAG